MRGNWTKLAVGLAMPAALAIGLMATPAQARWWHGDRYRGDRYYHNNWSGGWYGSPPVVYGGPYGGYGYYPPPVVYGPGIGFSFNIH